MLTLTTEVIAEMNKQGNKPILLIDILGRTFQFSTKGVTFLVNSATSDGSIDPGNLDQFTSQDEGGFVSTGVRAGDVLKVESWSTDYIVTSILDSENIEIAPDFVTTSSDLDYIIKRSRFV